MSSAFRKSPTPRNYEEFEELLRERREKVYSEHGLTKTSYLAPAATTTPTPTRNNNHNYTQRVSSPNNNNNIYTNASKAQKYNYDFEIRLINLNDEQNDSGVSGMIANDEPPPPPRRHYTLERIQQLSPRNTVERNYHTMNTTTKSTTANNWHTTLPPASPLIPTSTLTSSKTHAGAFNLHTERTERPPLELDVGYKRHFEMLQQQRQQWPGYNTNSKYNQSSMATTYGNGNVAGYHNTNNNIVNNDNFGKNHSWQEADIRSNVESAPIYATSMKQQRQQQQQLQQHQQQQQLQLQQQYKQATLSTKTNAGKIFYDETDFYRPETPAFPVTPRTPSLAPTLQRETFNNTNTLDTVYSRSHINSMPRSISNGLEPQEVAAHLVKFAKDSSQFWYKPNLSREEAISLLINATPGTFIVRDSTTYKNAYGLVLRVAQPPPGAAATGKPDDLVRHFLIEPTTRGVRLKGCANEPVFTSLSALVYEHSINQLALPCLLNIPEHDLLPPRTEPTPAQRQLLTQGAACNVLLLFSAETESLTGEEAIRKAIRQMYEQKPLPAPIEVHFKVSQQGITLTDNTRKRFFRKHYSPDIISYCAIDPDHRLWTMQDESQIKKTIFAFVARRSLSSKDNQCHIFCDLAINQPASAIVSYVNKTLPTDHQRNVIL